LNKRHALVFAFLLAGLIISDVFLFKLVSPENKPSRETAVIARVVDGDTLKLEDGRTLRLLNINSPEKGTIGANLSKDFLKSFENKTVEIEITDIDKYQRSLARIYSPEYLNLKIVELGFAPKFLVQDSELSVFSEAEENAIGKNLGIWKKSAYKGCFESETDENAETVRIKNNCEPLFMAGWFLKDESRKTYKFRNISFDEITLHSLNGTENSTDLFWQSESNIWNNDRDTLYLFDPEGGIAHHESYGY
jgi:endonuclease YncB( thermonuclease family)